MLRFDLTGGRKLRLLEESDAEELFDLIENNRAYLSRWMPFVARSHSPADLLAYVREARRALSERRGMQMAILERERIIGVVGFHGIDWTARSSRVGYWLVEHKQGAGTMTTAVHTLVGYALRVWDLERVEIHAATENTRSRAIPERLGFQEESIVAAAERIGDRVVDHVVYAITADDWRAQDAP